MSNSKASSPNRDDAASEREEQLRLLAEGVSDAAVILLDAEGRVASWNRGAERLKGYRAEEIVGRSYATFFTEADRESGLPERLLAEAAARDALEAEGWRVRKDGSRFWAHARVTPLRDRAGRIRGYAKVTCDRTELRTANEALQRANEDLERRVRARTAELEASAERLRAEVSRRREVERHLAEHMAELRDLYDHAPIGYHSLDASGTYVRINETELTWLGYRREEVVGRLTFVGVLSPESRPVFREAFARLVEGGEIHDVELTVIRRNGTAFPVLLNATAVRRRGRFVMSRASLVDISARKQMEDELREVATELDAFAHSVSHDLRAPLRAIRGFAESLLEDQADRLDAEGREDLHRIMASAERMHRLIEELLEYSRLGRREIRREPVPLDTTCAEVIADLAAQIGDCGAEVHLERPMPAVQAHRATLAQIVSNLVGNALKFVAPGVRPRVRLHAETRGDRVRLWVADNGIGIPREYQHAIFGVLRRLHPQSAYPGAGLGLSIVRRAAERLGGEVGVESREGEGSRFWVDLPRAPG